MFKKIALFVLASVSALAVGEIRNFHPLSEQIFRSAAPGNANIPLLAPAGFTHVLIFKNQTKNEVETEKRSLEKFGIHAENIYHIPFKWEDMGALDDSCDQVVQALALLAQIERSRSKKILFHCTLGEDRTGALAGLYRMLYSQWNIDRAFTEEMCARGYEAGDKGKPWKVVSSVRAEVTPVFLAVASLIMQKKLSFSNLNPKVCHDGSLNSPHFKALLATQNTRFTCK